MKHFLAALFALTLALPAAAAEMGDDGLHKTDWMRDTFKDLREDLAEANSEGKRLMLIFEQRGCIYCAKMHAEVFPRPEIDSYIRDHYFVVQLNLHGTHLRQTKDGFHGGGFTGTVRAHDHHDLSRLHPQRHTIENIRAAVTAVHIT